MRRAASALVVVVFLAAGLGLGVAVLALQSERAAHQATKSEHAEQRERAATAALRLSERNITLTKELTDATETHAQAQRALAAERRALADAVRAADGRVRDQARAYAAAAGARCADTTTAANEPTAGQAFDLLADLLARESERATVYAGHADDAYDRAAACAADYDRARAALNKD